MGDVDGTGVKGPPDSTGEVGLGCVRVVRRGTVLDVLRSRRLQFVYTCIPCPAGSVVLRACNHSSLRLLAAGCSISPATKLSRTARSVFLQAGAEEDLARDIVELQHRQ